MSYSCLAQAIIPITQGSDYSDTVQINQPDGAPMDLTGYTVRSQLRRVNGDLAATFACSVPTPASGSISRSLTAVQTAALVPTATISYVWGVELVNGSGKVMEIQGGARVISEVVK
ncbi:MAG: hypothetical protein ACOYL3_16195 [Desulfuromonadaceae bacterium]